jgi:hypothetical protein
MRSPCAIRKNGFVYNMLMDEQQESSQEANWQYTPEKQTATYDGADVSETRGVPLPAIPTVEWTASEYVAHEKSGSWYLAFLSGSLVIVLLIFLISRDILATIVVLLACITIVVYAGRKPGTNRYIVNENGVQVEDKIYQYSTFRSFSVVEEGAINSIWLKPLKRFAPVVVMYYSQEDEQKITDVLTNFLPHEERELDAIDRFSKRIRF